MAHASTYSSKCIRTETSSSGASRGIALAIGPSNDFRFAFSDYAGTPRKMGRVCSWQNREVARVSRSRPISPPGKIEGKLFSWKSVSYVRVRSCGVYIKRTFAQSSLLSRISHLAFHPRRNECFLGTPYPVFQFPKVNARTISIVC